MEMSTLLSQTVMIARTMIISRRPDEFAVISELLTSAKIFAQVIVKLCG